MYREINEDIYDLRERLRTKEKLESLRSMAMEELRKKKQNLEELRNILQKEEKDVLKLEGMSLSSFFLNIIGKKEDKLDEERKEYLGAKMQYDECILAIKELENEIEKYNKNLINYSEVKEEYQQLIKKKQDMIINEDTHRGGKLRDLLNKINELKLDIKEVKEAIHAGENALTALLDMKQPLESAHGWGVWDMLGGGFFTDIIKHSKIEDANKISYDVQQYLKRFQKELADVNEFTDIEVNIGSFATFADFFFDGLFADWFVQSKINESISNVENAYSRVESILSDLNRNLDIMQREMQSVEEEIKMILER
ncbi:hypothetical protein KQI38_04505 [Tissierella carlieri]|uniref:Uncharacterized protein n=1 Tax=Tissierella carlieri TaxID=689904 RepID=A0ABT1SFZ3_9FIRM|nr:hypothetical protein [Tissierella carlieri]MBU5311277.1 hypothetical protein [Tissierella carlieri]MCQ4925406.1 hypothetical protein [Tissierella carlieri]MDU5083024.1 hypothetical protein [Bacillota bacterium]